MTNHDSPGPHPQNAQERRLLALCSEFADAAEAGDAERGGRVLEQMVMEFGAELFRVFAEGLINDVFAGLAERMGADDPQAYAVVRRLASGTDN